MSEHIALEELFAFAYDKSMGPEAMARAARINAHLLVCPDCRSTFQALLDLRESVSALARHRAAQTQPGVVDRLLEEGYSADGVTLNGYPYPQMNFYVYKINRSYDKYTQLYGE